MFNELKILFVWCLKHSLNTNTLLSSSLNEQIADLSKRWMITAEDGCVGLLGDTVAFHSSPRSSVPRLCVLPKGSVSPTGCLVFSSPVMNMNHSRRKECRGGTARCQSASERRQLEEWKRAEVETKVIIMVPESDARLLFRKAEWKRQDCWLEKQCFS